MKSKIIGLGIAACICIVSCSEPNTAVSAVPETPIDMSPKVVIGPLDVLSVSDYDFTLDGEQAVSIYFGEAENKFCDISIKRSSVVVGYKVSSQRGSYKDINVTCTWLGMNYVDSVKYPTSFKFDITSIDSKSKIAEFKVSLKLVNPYSEKYLILSGTSLKINNDEFKNLKIN